VGPFEEEEERIVMVSDEVKVKGEDPATPRGFKGEQGEVARFYCAPSLSALCGSNVLHTLALPECAAMC